MLLNQSLNLSLLRFKFQICAADLLLQLLDLQSELLILLLQVIVVRHVLCEIVEAQPRVLL